MIFRWSPAHRVEKRCLVETSDRERFAIFKFNLLSCERCNLKEGHYETLMDTNEAIYGQAGGSKVKRLRNMKAVSAEKDGQLKTALTGNQFDLYLKYKNEMMEKIKENRKEG